MIEKLLCVSRQEKNLLLLCLHLHFILFELLLSVLQVKNVAFSSDESHFATCSEDGSVRVWSVPNNELVVQFQVLNQVKENAYEIF